MGIISEISKGKPGKSYQQGTEQHAADGTARKRQLMAGKQMDGHLKKKEDWTLKKSDCQV